MNFLANVPDTSIALCPAAAASDRIFLPPDETPRGFRQAVEISRLVGTKAAGQQVLYT